MEKWENRKKKVCACKGEKTFFPQSEQAKKFPRLSSQASRLGQTMEGESYICAGVPEKVPR